MRTEVQVMNETTGHWNRIFSTAMDEKLGWWEKDSAQTLKFIDLLDLAGQPTVFLAGAGTSLLVEDLLARGCRLVVNDISKEALARLQTRIGSAGTMRWLCHDLTRPLPADVGRFDLWIDRAVLHFILEEKSIAGYFTNLRNGLRPGGYTLLAEFSLQAVAKCAGLDLHRYSLTEMIERLGDSFELIEHEDYNYINPTGDSRSYIYALFKKQMLVQSAV
jgi:2-polyprenyl-3-methyl-5-hydroxy-6-metoxy-1,4-benzoquinol methylase